MATDVTKYAAEAAYKDIERDALARSEPQASPRAILLGGQPGAGKSELAFRATRELAEDGGAVVIDADRMRAANPRYHQLVREDPQNAADRTQAEAGQWATRLTIAAAEERRNLVVDGTMRNPDNIRDLATRLRESGYTVEARVLAVDAETSLTRARLRFEEQTEAGGAGRYVNREQHDAAYEALPRTVATLEREKLVDRIAVYDAQQRLVYENRLAQGQWREAPAAAQKLDEERARPYTPAETRAQVSALEDIASLARDRTGQPDREIEAKLERARSAWAVAQQSPAFQRAEAFDNLPKGEALARHPELDGAYAQLRDTRSQFPPAMSRDEREQSYLSLAARLSEQLQRGEVPRGSVTREESERVIDLAARERGFTSVRSAAELNSDVRGEVVATSSHHALIKLSDQVAVRVERPGLDHDLSVGERVAIQFDKGQGRVYELGKEPGRDLERGHDRGMDRDLWR